MALTPGLSPNIRLPGDAPEELQHEGIEIELADEGDAPNVDEKGNLLTIEHGDGSVTLTLDGSPLESANEGGPEGWFDNLVDKINEAELARISEELLKGVQDDLDSRKEWIDDRAQGIKLMGLKIEIPASQGLLMVHQSRACQESATRSCLKPYCVFRRTHGLSFCPLTAQ